MPIKITDFEWKQNESLAFIKFGLRNTSLKNVDIIYTTSYLKVNFCPYIFEVFLKYKIDPEKSSALIKDGNLHFHLLKAKIESWETLEENLQNKEDAQEMRKEALKEYEYILNKNSKERKENKISLERLAVSRQISLNEEKHLAEKELLKQEEKIFFQENDTASESSPNDNRIRLSSLCSEDGSAAASEGDYDGDEESTNYSSTEHLPEITKSKGRKGSCPDIRPSSCIKIRHTSHKASVPKRESLSSSQEEEIVITNGKEILANKENSEKEKLNSEAKKYFESGDYEKAVKKYSALLELCPAQASFYSNRAAAHLAIKCHKEAVEDCTKAFDLLKPPSKENAKSRLLCHIRRGMSYVRLKDLSSAVLDYESALRLEPNNMGIAKDLASIKRCLKTCSTSDTGEDSSEGESSSEDLFSNSEEHDNRASSPSE